jgi:hypothetical protein
MTIRHRTAACALLAAASSAAAFATGTVAWEMNSYTDFIRGRFNGVSLSRDGRLSLAPRLDTVFAAGEAVIWSVVRGRAGELYAATGHRGRVYRIDRSGKSELIWTAEQPEVFALAIGRDGALYAGASPGGKVYRISGRKAAEYFDPGARYIWSLAVGEDGALYVGTGDKGKVFRVEAAGKGTVWYETGQSHVTGLAIDAQGRLLAGTEPNGILYRVTAKDKAFVLYDSTLPEIRSIVPMPDGTVYASALGGSLAGRAAAAAQAAQGAGAGGAVSTPAMTITVEAQNTQPSADIKPPQPEAARQQQATAAAAAQVTTQFSPVVDMTGVEKSAVYRINPDNTVETLWTSKEENVYDLLALEKQILFSTDVSGRIYGLSPDRRVTLIAQTNEGETTRLIPDEGAVLAATGDIGRIYRLDEAAGTAGSYESPVHDAGTAARWGSLSWRADVPPGCAVRFRTRTGNSARPDRTWSEWSEPLTAGAGSRIASPNARYIAWKLEVTGSAGATPLLTSVTLAYLPQNSPPVLKSINVITQAAAVSQTAKAAATQASGAPYTVTVSDTGEASAGSSSAGTPTQTLTRASAQQVTVTWQAEDPDGDRLVYTIYFRGDEESQWKMLRANMRENSITFDSDVFADGKYFYRVVASDKEANPPAAAREAQLLSPPVMIDNTPPAVTIGQVQTLGGGKWRIDFEAADTASPLRRCEYSLDASSWVPVESADGVIDSLREKFSLELTGVAPGEHLLVIRAADSANNTGLAKTILK